MDYYRYSGDPAAIAHLTFQADALLDHCLTPPDHPWPRFLVSVPVKGKPYGQCDPQGMIQLDIVAEVGLALLKAHQVTGERRWLEACQHWGDLLAEKRNRVPGQPPWQRYAVADAAPWKDDKQTGGVVFLLYFFDELLRLGHRGPGDAIVAARDAGRAYLHDVLLPAWTVNDVWGRNYWDWADDVQAENVTEFAARYFLDNQTAFPHWRNDSRNILSLFLNHTSVSQQSDGEVYSGAWAFPESSGCCGRSLWYGPMELAVAFAQYGVEGDSAWGRELARRMQILATYDGHDTGVSEDKIDGGFVVNNSWFKIAHPMALKHLLATMAWLPEYFAPCRENHIVRSSAVVNSVTYGKGRIDYTTFDAPANTIDVLRLAFAPVAVTTDNGSLSRRDVLAENGFRVQSLDGGDYLVMVRHDGAKHVTIEGDDPQQVTTSAAAQSQGSWESPAASSATGQSCLASDQPRASLEWRLQGNQLRVVGSVGPDGGLADVFLDGVQQLVPIDCWNPAPRHEQVLYYRNGLSNTEHTLRITARGKGNPRASGKRIYVAGLQSSSAQGQVDCGSGQGPTESQRMVFGYPGRDDLSDKAGNFWRPGTEFVVRVGHMTDSVEQTWWTQPVSADIANTDEDDLYRYGIHAREFCVNTTVGPGTYHVRLKFAATRGLDTCENCVTVCINGQERITKMDVAATAGGPLRAADLVFNNVTPRNGIIDVAFRGGDPAAGFAGEAFVQALEVAPGPGGEGVAPVSVLVRNLLRNAGFEVQALPAEPLRVNSWTFMADPGSNATIHQESAHARAASVPAQIGTGNDAVRIAGQGHSRLSQVIAVRADAIYRGSVWVQTRDENGKGFGRGSRDAANLILEELDGQGRLLKSHRQIASRRAEPYRFVACEFRTSPATSHVRFVLDTAINGPSSHGSVIYDQCVFDGPPAPATLSGCITDRLQRPVELVLVSAGNQQVRSDKNGKFTIANLSDLTGVTVRVEKKGYYAQSKQLVVGSGENRLDFGLTELPAGNLLTNGDFELGFAEARSPNPRHGPAGTRGPWAFQFSRGVNCYIYPESIYEWRKPVIFRGKEAISHVTDGGGEIRLFQDVAANPEVELVASAWIRGLDVRGDGKGFGADPGDFAGFLIEELDAGKRVLKTHDRVGIRQGNSDFEHIEFAFVTRQDTAFVRFVLCSKIACEWSRGAAIYDDCVLLPK
jgi:hypothetical protein